MNQTRLVEIGLDLATLQRKRAELAVRSNHLTQDAEARRLAMAPAEGWPGKNEEARRLAAQQAFAADPSLIDMAEDLTKVTDELAHADAEIAALDSERRGLEWAIRGQLVEQLIAAGIPRSGEAVEAVQDQQIDQAAFSLDDLPF